MRGRESRLIVAFGTLWGVWEMVVGSILLALQIPMRGTILTFGGLIIALTGRYLVKKRGSIVTMGAIAAFLKLFSLGGVVLSPFIAIMIESLIAEVLTLVGRNTLISFIFGGAFAMIWPPIHFLIAQGIVYGSGIYKVYIDFIKILSHILKLSEGNLWIFVVIIFVSLFIFGGIAGFISYKIGREVEKFVERKE